ncbi:hypothetical protein CSC12_2576 [Klebsiella michiganensis]|nr:hypothetical protein CSC12_2576 [Klebsiella michiganensis]
MAFVKAMLKIHKRNDLSGKHTGEWRSEKAEKECRPGGEK